LAHEGLSRLATMRLLTALGLTFALGMTAAVTLASCGGRDDAQLLPGADAREITANLDAVEQLASEGECAGAAEAAEQVGAQVEALEGVDAELQQALERGAARLNEVVDTCEEETTEEFVPVPEPSESDDEDQEKEEEKEEKEREREEEKAEKDEEKEAEREEKESEEEPPAEEVEPPEEPSGGISPSSEVEEGDDG